MSHMVIYRGADGKPGYHQTDDIHDAVNFVEQMRNEEGVEHARIFRLEEVVFEYRPYYRVELTNDTLPPGPENGTAQLAESNGSKASAQVGSGTEEVDLDEAIDVVEEADSADDGDGAEENGEVKADAGSKKGLFGR